MAELEKELREDLLSELPELREKLRRSARIADNHYNRACAWAFNRADFFLQYLRNKYVDAFNRVKELELENGRLREAATYLLSFLDDTIEAAGNGLDAEDNALVEQIRNSLKAPRHD